MVLKFFSIFSFFASVGVCLNSFADTTLIVDGRNFKVPATQEIRFVAPKKFDSAEFKKIPDKIDLRSIQSSVKSQGKRGACTYFVITSLVESLIKKSTGREIDISEEYLAWSAKTKKKLRTNEEDSSVAVNAAEPPPIQRTLFTT